MAKIQRYKLEYGYGSLVKEMTRTLEPVSDSDYIEVSELREWVEKEKDRQNEMKLGTDSVVGAYYLGGLETINKLLAAIDTEGK